MSISPYSGAEWKTKVLLLTSFVKRWIKSQKNKKEIRTLNHLRTAVNTYFEVASNLCLITTDELYAFRVSECVAVVSKSSVQPISWAMSRFGMRSYTHLVNLRCQQVTTRFLSYDDNQGQAAQRTDGHSNTITNQKPIQYMSTKPDGGQAPSSSYDMIGQPHPVSNLRPVCFHIPQDESSLEKDFRLEREKVQNWNQTFWTQHNKSFVEERTNFIAATQMQSGLDSKCAVSADEMSVFYKAFLDKNWRRHLSYNLEWYKMNTNLAVLALRVKFHQMTKVLSGNT